MFISYINTSTSSSDVEPGKGKIPKELTLSLKKSEGKSHAQASVVTPRCRGLR